MTAAPQPGRCKYCGCTEASPCTDRRYGEETVCTWRNGSNHTVCTGSQCLMRDMYEQRRQQQIAEARRKRRLRRWLLR